MSGRDSGVEDDVAPQEVARDVKVTVCVKSIGIDDVIDSQQLPEVMGVIIVSVELIGVAVRVVVAQSVPGMMDFFLSVGSILSVVSIIVLSISENRRFKRGEIALYSFSKKT
ncbi:hypothetical protein QBC43DRAFT_353436 [Cladorrhinum sp. PSN259]|nr:hypothetical protein QBC43DRAFT_353436 [Cladorrhinum sp. PSN259]